MPGGRKPSKDSKAIIVDGFRFYPTKQGYYAGSVGKKKIKRLHIYVWEKHNGVVPKGYHIHHKDGNKANNSIDNLQMINGYGHLSLHSSSQVAKERARKNMNEKARPKAIEWHKGTKGRVWHKEHWNSSILPSIETKVKKVCLMCGREYETPKLCALRSKFCSNNCKGAFRSRQKGGRSCAYHPYKEREQAESI